MVENKRASTSLFDDYEFLIILLALFAVLVGGGLIWEYFYYKPKMERLNKVTGECFCNSTSESELNHEKVDSRQYLKIVFFLKKLSLLCNDYQRVGKNQL